MLRRFATALALGSAVVLVGGVADATTTVLTDAVGDATLCHNYYLNPIVVQCPSVDSDPTIDIVSADIATSPAGDLVAKLHVLDLDDPFSSDRKDTRYSFATYLDQGAAVIQLTAERHGDAVVGKLYVAGSSGGSTVLTPVTFNFSTNHVRWALPLSVVNERLDIACASCPDVATGTLLTNFSIATSASQLSVYTDLSGGETSGGLVSKGDRAFSETTYTVGS
ncbi:MAG TPA: hypothetical protein VF230_00400 [Acidimicrobiales bacterium]